MLQAIHSAQESVSQSALETGMLRHDQRALGIELAGVQTRLARATNELAEALGAILAAAGEATARKARNTGSLRSASSLNISFNKTNAEALRWALLRSGVLITNISDETLSAIRKVMARAFTEGIAPREAARLIAPLVGLTEPQAEAVLNLRQAMVDNPGGKVWAGEVGIRVPEGGASEELLAERAEQYAERLLRQRAETIARTETIAASNEGQRELWVQAREEGLLTGNERRVWITTPDDRADEECLALDGETTGIDEPFPGGIMNPPLHPNCRCATGLVAPEGA